MKDYSKMNCFDQNTWLRHLQEDILPYWTTSAALGNPQGNFPTYLDQNSEQIPDQQHYIRTIGRQIYMYLEAYHLLKEQRFLNYAEAGFSWMEKHAKNPRGGFYTIFEENGHPLNAAITLQDLSYGTLPYVAHYSHSGDTHSLSIILEITDLIADGPFFQAGILHDALDVTYQKVCPFEGTELNIVSVLDFLNVIVIPMLNATIHHNNKTLQDKFLKILEKFLDLLVQDFFADNIFWNNCKNRTDFSAKHVDLGHTSKAYGIVFQANRLLSEQNRPVKYWEIEKEYLPIVKAASSPIVGWKTDFDCSPVQFIPGALQWWRHILINQTTALYVQEYPELLPFLKNGLETWLTLPYVDKTRRVRGIREGLQSDGTVFPGDADSWTCKANHWKNGYHETEHIVKILSFIAWYKKKESL